MTEGVRTPNVYGVETEYSVLLTFPKDVVYELVGACHSVDRKLGLYVEPQTKGASKIPVEKMDEAINRLGIYGTATGMLSNGGRFYIDPSGPEYATPETTTAEDAVHRAFDGDELVYSIMSGLRESGVLKSFQLNRRIVDHNRTSRGVHLNNTTSLPAIPSEEAIGALSALNIVKGSMFGSGGLLVDAAGKTAFHHSPRLSLTNSISASYSNYTERPLVRLPFKPEVDDLARVETVSGDALNFGWPFRASLVATNSLIRLLEIGRPVIVPTFKDPVAAAQIVGHYGYRASLEVFRPGKEGQVAKPHELLSRICEGLVEADEVEDFLDDEARQVLLEIVDVADMLKVDPESLSDQVESISRAKAMRKKIEKKKVKLNSETMCRFDFAWDWIGGGVAETLRNRKRYGWQGFQSGYSPHETARRRITPPSDTRAAARGQKIERTKGETPVDWYGTRKNPLHPLGAKASSIFLN